MDNVTDGKTYILLRSFLSLCYSLCRQYIVWYDMEIKNKVERKETQ